ncbi:hypothetical protein EPH95_17335 [Salicibibacter halophilus]|uniref:YtxH domain-containing protein n=1 Tax=Salicibibacter halophilus TaxID=2502791 RepID=A0A514LN71_9BACI|nr:hypothetical protein [Salicibibacter halophilus]QDI92731.1 hypothetical protein EPH95_17335 [Salicibibacter halophilus]
MAGKETRWATYITVGSVSALVGFLFLNKNARNKTATCVKEGKQFVTDASGFVKENREEISELLKGTTERVNERLQVAGEDVEQIVKHASHLKESATDIMATAKEAGRELQQHREDYKNQTGPLAPTQLPPNEK